MSAKMIGAPDQPEMLQQVTEVLHERLSLEFGLVLERQSATELARAVICAMPADEPNLCSLCRESAQRDRCDDCAGGRRWVN